MKIVFILFAALMVIPFAYAQGTEADPYRITNTGSLQVFHGEMGANPVYYRLASDRPFRLEVQGLAPYEDGYDANAHQLTVIVWTENRMEVGSVQENSYFWSTRKIGDDYYFAVPKISSDVPAGNYIIRLASSSGSAKYALAVGSGEPDIFFSALAGRFQNIPIKFIELLGIVIMAGAASIMLFAGIISRKNKDTNRLLIDFYYKTRYFMWAGIIVAFIGYYAAGSFGPIGKVQAFMLALILIHWTWFFLTNNEKIDKIKNRKAIFAEKFQRRFARAMLIQLILLVILLFFAA